MKLKQIRLSKHITQKELADAIGVDHTIISKYETGLVSPPFSRLKKMAQVLGVSVDDLMEEKAPDFVLMLNGKEAVLEIDRDKHQRSEREMTRRLIEYCHGICELCGRPAPFRNKNGVPFLESHYVKWLSKGGAPTFDNMVVLCPNCHRRIHELHLDEDIQYLSEVARSHKIDDEL